VGPAANTHLDARVGDHLETPSSLLWAIVRLDGLDVRTGLEGAAVGKGRDNVFCHGITPAEKTGKELG
jgi:hypothetical protein